MQERVKTSFIPKASLKTERRKPVSQSPIGIVNVVASIILLAAIIGAVGMFFFEQFTIQNIARKRESLDRARAAFEPATIKELARLNTRLESGKTLLSQHVAPSWLFGEIEDKTLATVRFKDFAFAESGPGRTEISMSGEALSFNALALQSDIFGKSDFLSEPIFSNFNIDPNGNVVFEFSAVVDLNEINYRGTRAEPAPENDASSTGDPFEVTP